jgi:hypothetical protein
MDFNIDDFLNQTFKNLESNKTKKQGKNIINNNNLNDNKEKNTNKNNKIQEEIVNLYLS